MTRKNSFILILSAYFFLISCGFSPIYKISDDNLNIRNYNLKLVNNVSREIEDEVKNALYLKDNFVYEVLLKIQEEQTPLIINTNGTVSKYRIEVSINFEIKGFNLSGSTIRSSQHPTTPLTQRRPLICAFFISCRNIVSIIEYADCKTSISLIRSFFNLNK